MRWDEPKRLNWEGAESLTDEELDRTWDGQLISGELPRGISIVVFRRFPKFSVLLLHRAHQGPMYEGDWAWTPPSGARHPGEPVIEAARRELYEEAGLLLRVRATALGTPEWAVFLAEATADDRVSLVDPEHDRFVWVESEEAIRRVEPAVVKESLERTLKAVLAQQ